MNTIKKAIIFDRDGVLNKDKGYIHSWDELEWIDGAREAVARLTEDGWLLFCRYKSKRCSKRLLYRKRRSIAS